MARVAMAACVIGLLLARSPGVAATWDSAGQFSGIQGQSDWFYQYGSAPLRDDNLTFDASAGTWKHPTIAYLWLWAIGGHPGPTLAAARNWRSPFIGSANVSVDLSDADPNCGDGIVASIYRNSLLVWGPTTMANGGSLTPFTLPHVPVERGDLLSFRIGSGAANNNACDATTFRVTLDGSPNRWAAPGPEGITGTIEQATATVVSGWATDRDANGNPITVHIYGRRDVPGVPHGESAAPGPGGCRSDDRAEPWLHVDAESGARRESPRRRGLCDQRRRRRRGRAARRQPVGREPASREPRSPARGPRAANERPDQLPGRAGRHHHVEGRQAPLPRRRPQPEQLAGDRAGRR